MSELKLNGGIVLVDYVLNTFEAHLKQIRYELQRYSMAKQVLNNTFGVGRADILEEGFFKVEIGPLLAGEPDLITSFAKGLREALRQAIQKYLDSRGLDVVDDIRVWLTLPTIALPNDDSRQHWSTLPETHCALLDETLWLGLLGELLDEEKKKHGSIPSNTEDNV